MDPITCKSILIVEDHQDIRESLQEALELAKYKVYTASNGKTGIEVLEKIEKPCLILLDLMMPVLDGWEFRKIQKQNNVIASIPVVVISAMIDKIESIEACAYLKKPVDLQTLLQVVKTHCGP